MINLKYTLCLLVLLTFCISPVSYALNNSITRSAPFPAGPYNLTTNNTFSITYTVNYKLVNGTNTQLDFDYDATKLQLIGNDLIANSGVFMGSFGPAGAYYYKTATYTTALSYLASAQFTLTFKVITADCNPTPAIIDVSVSTMIATVPTDVKDANAAINIVNTDLAPSISMQLIDGSACMGKAMYMVTTNGPNGMSGGSPDGYASITLPASASVIGVYNSVGVALPTYPFDWLSLTLSPKCDGAGKQSFVWNRTPDPILTQQVFYVFVDYSTLSSDDCNGIVCAGFFNRNFCSNSDVGVSVMTSLNVSGCPCPPDSTVGYIPSSEGVVIIKKTLIKPWFQYWPSPDNCKTSDYIIQVDNLSMQDLPDFKVQDLLANINATLGSGAILVTDIQASLTNILSGFPVSTFTFTVPTPSPSVLFSPAASPLSSGTGYQRIYALNTTPSPNDYLWPGSSNPTWNITALTGTTFPKMGSLKIRITHRLGVPNPGNLTYTNAAIVSFTDNGPKSATAIWHSKMDSFVAAVTIDKGAKRNAVAGNYYSAITANPGELVDFQIRIKNFGLMDGNVTLTDILTNTNSELNIVNNTVSVSNEFPTTVYSLTELSTVLTNLSPIVNSGANSGNFNSINPLVIKRSPSCSSISDLLINYTEKIPDNPGCNSSYLNSVTLYKPGTTTVVDATRTASIAVDAFTYIEYKLEATCDTTDSTSWQTGNIDALPGQTIYYRASVRNNNLFALTSVGMMVQLPDWNPANNTSTHSATPLVTLISGTTVPGWLSSGNLSSTGPGALDFSGAPPINNWLTGATFVPTPGFNELYKITSLNPGGAEAVIRYQVTAPTGTATGSQFNTAFGISLGRSTPCPFVVQTNHTLTIADVNECDSIPPCDLITLADTIEYKGGDNYKLTIYNINAGSDVNRIDVVVHEPYRNCAGGIPTGIPYSRPMLPYTLGAVNALPPLSVSSLLSPGQRYYQFGKGAVPLNSGSLDFTINATIPVPNCNNGKYIFPVNIVFKDTTRPCTICEKTIYLSIDPPAHGTDHRVDSFVVKSKSLAVATRGSKGKIANQSGKPPLLNGEEDPVNVGLNNSRKAFAKMKLGRDVESWYSSVKKNKGVEAMLNKHYGDVQTLLGIARKLIEGKGQLEADDLIVIEKSMRLIDSEIAHAPSGLIDESMKRLKASVGMRWDGLMKNLLVPPTKRPIN